MKKNILICILFLSLIIMQDNKHGKNMKMMMKWKLIEYLDLSEDQAEKFFPRMNSHEKGMKDINLKVNLLKNDLEEYISSGSIPNMKNQKIINEIQELEKNRIDLKFDYFKSLDEILEPLQISKLIIFDKKFRKTLKDQLNKKSDRIKQKN